MMRITVALARNRVTRDHRPIMRVGQSQPDVVVDRFTADR